MSGFNFVPTNQYYNDGIVYNPINNGENYSHTQNYMNGMHFQKFQNQPMNNIQELDSQSIANTNFNHCDGVVPYNDSPIQNSTQQQTQFYSNIDAPQQQTQFYSNIDAPQQNIGSFNPHEYTQPNLQSTENIRFDNNYHSSNQMNFSHDGNIWTNTSDYGCNNTNYTIYHHGNQNLNEPNSIPSQFQQSFASQQSSLSYPPQSPQDCSCRHRKGCILENNQHISFDAQQNVSRHFNNYADIDGTQQNSYVSNLNSEQCESVHPVNTTTSSRGRITEQERTNINNERSRIYQQNKSRREKQAKDNEEKKIKELSEEILKLQKQVDMKQEQLNLWEIKLDEMGITLRKEHFNII